MIYLDHAATSPLLPKVKEAMITAMDLTGNPASPHKLGKSLQVRLEESRFLFQSKGPGKFIFTSSATESNNTIIQMAINDPKKRVWLAKGDHPSISKFCEGELTVAQIPYLPNGRIDFDRWLTLLDSEDQLIAFSHVDGQTGVLALDQEQINTIKEKLPNCWLHLDASQSFGKINFNFEQLTIDSMTICSHKIGGPVGIAGLYYKKPIEPLLTGGGHENGLRSSTPSLLLVEGFCCAIKEVESTRKPERHAELQRYKKELQELLTTELPIKTPFSEFSIPQFFSFFTGKLTSDLFLRFYEEREVYLSSTAACSSKNKKENLALAQLGYDKTQQQQFLRLSFGPEFDRVMMDQLIVKTTQILKEIKPLL